MNFERIWSGNAWDQSSPERESVWWKLLIVSALFVVTVISLDVWAR